MMKKLLILGSICVLSFSGIKLNAQQNDESTHPEVYVKEHVRHKDPVPYKNVRESDVMWSKTIFRIVDLRERMNYPLYYPLTPIGNRKSFIHVILEGIDEYSLPVYDAMDPYNEFAIELTPDRIDKQMGADSIKIKVQQADGSFKETIEQNDRQTRQVKQLLIKELWFFDKNYSTMQVRTIGICPIRIYHKIDPTTGIESEELTYQKTFWLYYPAFRGVFASNEVFNQFNDAQRVSYDDVFYQRRFSSVIVKESNIHDNRDINTYTSGLHVLYEAEQVKDYLFTVEHDLWEY